MKSNKQKFTILIDDESVNELLRIQAKRGFKYKSEAVIHCLKLGIIADKTYIQIDKELTKISTKYAKETTSLTEIVNDIKNDEHTYNKDDWSKSKTEPIEDIKNAITKIGRTGRVMKESIGPIENIKLVEDGPIIFTDKGNLEERYAKSVEQEKYEDEEECSKNANCSSCRKHYDSSCLLESIEEQKQKEKQEENIKALSGEEIEDIETKTVTEIKEPTQHYKNRTNQMVLSKPDKYKHHNDEQKIILGGINKQLQNAKDTMLSPLIKGYCNNCKNHKIIIDKNGNTTGCTCFVSLTMTHMKNCDNYANPQVGECTLYKKMEVIL